MPIRPTSSVCMQILKPLPSRPSRFSFGTILSVNTISEVWTPCSPILFSIFPTEKPGKVLSMMKAESPFVPLDLSVMAKMTNTPALEPFVMKISSSR